MNVKCILHLLWFTNSTHNVKLFYVYHQISREILEVLLLFAVVIEKFHKIKWKIILTFCNCLHTVPLFYIHFYEEIRARGSLWMQIKKMHQRAMNAYVNKQICCNFNTVNTILFRMLIVAHLHSHKAQIIAINSDNWLDSIFAQFYDYYFFIIVFFLW